jgi:hypothetical protein
MQGGFTMAKKSYTIVGVVTLDFTVDIEANSPEEAEELGRQYLEENYLTEGPTCVEANVIDVC